MAGNLTAMIASIFSGSAVTADPYYEYTTLLLPGSGTNGAQNNTFLDSSTNNFTITRNGNTTQGTFSPFSQTGWGNYFDGTGDYLSNASNSIVPTTGDFTIEGWFYPSQVSTIQYIFGTGGSPRIDVYINSSAYVGVQTGGSYRDSSTTKIIANAWNYIAITRTGSTYAIFVNGVSQTIAGTGTMASTITNTPTYIGTYSSTTSNFTGYICGLRVSTVVRTGLTTLPTSLYTSDASTSLLTCQSNRFIDNSTNNFTITVNGDTRVVAFSPFNPTASWSAATYGGSGYFDGSGDYLSIADNAAFTATGDFCLEAWCYLNSLPADYGIVAFGNGGGAGGEGYSIRGGGSTAVFSTTTGNITSASQFSTGSWIHVALLRSGTGSNNVAAYVNGTRIGTQSSTATFDPPGGVVGRYYTGVDNYYLNGYVSNTRLVVGSAVYQTGGATPPATITVPTAPLTAITNTSLLLNFTNAGIYDATSKNDLETVGNAQISNTTAKFGSTSMYFDGTGDWLLNQSPIPPTTFGSGDFSIEMWIYATTSGTQRWLFDGRIATPADGAYPAIYITSGNVLVYYVSAAARITGTTTITTNTWHFVQVIRTSGTTKMYLNGTQEGSNYTDSTVYLNPGVSRPIIGAATNLVQPFTGYIQDLRVTTGYARPTTTPTAAFPTL